MTNYDNAYGLVNTLTLEMVLNDEAPNPYSLKDFIKYLKQTYCIENLEFYRDVTEYKSVCYSFFGPILLPQQQEEETIEIEGGVKLSNGRMFYFRKDQEYLLNNDEKVFFNHLVIKFNLIMENYVFFNALKEINIPSDLKQQLLHSYSNQYYHPHILQSAYTSIIELLRISAFIPFITDANRFPISPSTSTSSSTSSSNHDINELISSTAMVSISTSITNSNLNHHHNNNNNNNNIDPTSSSIISSSSSISSHYLPWNHRRLKSSPSLNTSALSTSTTLNSELPLPKPSHSSSTKNSKDMIMMINNKDDAASVYSYKSGRLLRLPSPTSPNSEQSSYFIKKVITSTLKIRPNSNNNSNINNTTPSPKPPTRPTGGWKRINIPDPSIFQQLPKTNLMTTNTTTNTNTNHTTNHTINIASKNINYDDATLHPI